MTGNDGIVETPSDHFALAATLRLQTGALLPVQSKLRSASAVEGFAAPASPRRWSLQNCMEAVAPDSRLVFNSANANGNLQAVDWMNVTDVVGALNKDPSLWSGPDCYVFSRWRKKWYKLWHLDKRWDLKQTQEVSEVEPSLVFHAVKAPTEAVAMLNGDSTLCLSNTCFVYSEYYGKWYKLCAQY